MKFLSILFLLSWIPQSQIKPGKYVHKSNKFEYSLTLNKDSTFIYEKPALFFKGIITEAGTWEILLNDLILKDSIEKSFSKSKVYGQKDEKKNFVEIKFVDENEKPLVNWEASLNDDDLKKKTDNLGLVTFDYSEIKMRRSRQPKNTVEVISFRTKTEEITVAVDSIFNNQITVVHDFNPQTIKQFRQITIKVRDDILLFKNPTGMNEEQKFEFRRQEN